MKIGRGKNSSDLSPINMMGNVTAKNYAEKAIAFGRAHGSFFVIRGVDGIKGSLATDEPATDAQWLAWLRYFDDKRIPCEFMAKHGMSTVPAEWPEDFDPTAPTSDKMATIPRIPPKYVDQKDAEALRRSIGRLFRGLHSTMAGREDKPRRPPTAEEIAAGWKTPPAKLSGEALGGSGMGESELFAGD